MAETAWVVVLAGAVAIAVFLYGLYGLYVRRCQERFVRDVMANIRKAMEEPDA